MTTAARTSPSGAVTSLIGSITFDAADCGAEAVTPQTLTIPGVAAGDGINLYPPAAGLGVALAIGAGYGSAANTAVVPFINPTAGALNPGSLVYRYQIVKNPG